MNATLRWTLPPDLLILNYDDEAVTEAPLQPEDVTIGSVHPNIVYMLIRPMLRFRILRVGRIFLTDLDQTKHICLRNHNLCTENKF